MTMKFAFILLSGLVVACSADSPERSAERGTGGGLSGGGFETSLRERYRSIPIEVNSPEGTTPTVYVRVSNADAMIRQRGDQNAEQYERWILDELKIYTDESGNSWRPPTQWQVNSLLSELAPEFDMVLRSVDQETIGVFSDTCAEGCIVSFRASFADPGSARNRENFWEEQPELWLETELRYEKMDRVELTRLVDFDDRTGNGVVELGAVVLRLEADSLTATLETVDVAVWHPRRAPGSDDADMDAGPMIRESADGTRTEVPRE